MVEHFAKSSNRDEDSPISREFNMLFSVAFLPVMTFCSLAVVMGFIVEYYAGFLGNRSFWLVFGFIFFDALYRTMLSMSFGGPYYC